MAENKPNTDPGTVQIDEILSVTAGMVNGKPSFIFTIRAGGDFIPQSISVDVLKGRRLINDMNHLLKKSPALTEAERKPDYDTSTLMPPHWLSAGLEVEPPPYPKKGGGRGRKKK